MSWCEQAGEDELFRCVAVSFIALTPKLDYPSLLEAFQCTQASTVLF